MIWLTGDRGMLGRELSREFDRRGIASSGTDRECDIADPVAVEAVLAERRIDWIVNCAAYTAVDRAEDEPEAARRINVLGPRVLARAAASFGAGLLHLSTDYVFDGEASRPREPEDPVSPASVYGRTKAEGETEIRLHLDRHVILRTAWLYGKHGSSFVSTMLRLMGTKDELAVVADQRGTPTWTADLAGAIADLLSGGREPRGTYHYTGAGETTWYDFARAIGEGALRYGLVAKVPPIRPITSDEYPSRARRPAYSVLSCARIARELGRQPPAWEASLDSYLAGLAGSPQDAAAGTAAGGSQEAGR